MELLILALGVVVAIVAIVASWRGAVEGPLLLGLGGAGLAALLLLRGTSAIEQLAGVLFLGGSIAEFGAAFSYRQARQMRRQPSPGWKQLASLVGCAGVIGFGLLLMWALMVLVAWLSHPI